MGVDSSFICSKTCLNDNKCKEDVVCSNTESLSTES